MKYPEDSDSTKTVYTYDSMYRTASVVKNLSDTTALGVSYSYDGDKLSGITTKSTNYGFTYGPFGLTESISAGGQELVNYGYSDDYRYLTSVDYGNGDSVQYTIDKDGRVTAKTYEDNETVTYEYDNNGELGVMKDSASESTTRYFYDLSGRLSKYIESAGTDAHSVAYIYNDRNQLSKVDETIDGVLHRGNYYYDEDGRVKQIYNEYARLFRDYTYGSLPLVTERYTHSYGNMLLQEYFTYRKPSNGCMTGQVETHRFEALNYNVTYSYTYDDNGNISSISDGTHTTSYVYDAANQLIRENNQKGGFTYIWTYDDAGNILSRHEYAYTTGTVGALRDTVTYTYGNSNNKDILTAYDGAAITRDAIGNPLSDGTWTYTWEHGRQLKSMSDGTVTWNYTYNADGMRTSRTNGSKTYEYIYNGSQLSRMTISENGTTTTYDFTYDAEGAMVLTVNGYARYIYVKNLQGDIIAILDAERTAIVEYTYDAWGNILSIEGSAKDSLGEANPLRYRGYVYDIETGLYYLQSRYYGPEMGRFINADEYASTGQGILGNNMYVYCLNNPVIYKDSTGNVAETVFDVISLGFSIADVIANPKDPWAWAGLVGDIVDVAVPFVAGVGEVIKAAKIADTAIDTVDTVHDATRAADKIDDGIKYTDKVIAQMENTNDLNHSFPLVIDTMMDAGTSKPLIGGDGMIREIIEIPGAINGKQGVYEYIIGPDRWCNHRFFREWR